jgi:hypothetical protein
MYTFHNWDEDDPSNDSDIPDIPDRVIIYEMSILNTTTRNKRVIYGHVTPNVVDQYWEAYAATLAEDEVLVISIYEALVRTKREPPEISDI